MKPNTFFKGFFIGAIITALLAVLFQKYKSK